MLGFDRMMASNGPKTLTANTKANAKARGKSKAKGKAKCKSTARKELALLKMLKDNGVGPENIEGAADETAVRKDEDSDEHDDKAEHDDKDEEEVVEPTEGKEKDEKKKPKPRGKAKGKAKAGASKAVDWSTWAQSNDAAGPEEEQTEGKIDKRVRSKKHVITPGMDDNGNPLPADDDSGYSPQQKHVFNRAIAHMPAEFRKTYDDMVVKKDRKSQNMLINALVAKTAKYASIVNIEEAESFVSRVITRTTTETRSEQLLGITQCEAEGRAGSAAQLLEGIKRGDVFVDTDGFYIFRRKKIARAEGMNDTTLAQVQGQATSEDATCLMVTMHDDFGWHRWAFETGAAAASSEDTVNLKIGASDKAMAALQDAYDTVSKIVRDSRTNAKSMAAMIAEDTTKDMVGTIAELIQKAQKAIKAVQAIVEELDDMMILPRMSLNDGEIKKQLNDAAPVVGNLVAISNDLKSLLRSKK